MAVPGAGRGVDPLYLGAASIWADLGTSCNLHITGPYPSMTESTTRGYHAAYCSPDCRLEVFFFFRFGYATLRGELEMGASHKNDDRGSS